ncbi:MAG: hypothetical protein H6867_01180 [Rhodospirillales bacterium]|nr:hypothetical protein [Rhodospirillales bacterium]MCB9997128.1 hypothetical protein [Rhodospirillales bacterium]
MKDFFDDTGELQVHTKKPLLKAIREKCLDCCAQQHSEVRLCHISGCPLWPYRMGKNPFHGRRMTDEQKQAATQQIKKAKKESYSVDSEKV